MEERLQMIEMTPLFVLILSIAVIITLIAIMSAVFFAMWLVVYSVVWVMDRIDEMRD